MGLTISGICAMRRSLKFAISEIQKIGILRADDVLDGHVVRMPKPIMFTLAARQKA